MTNRDDRMTKISINDPDKQRSAFEGHISNLCQRLSGEALSLDALRRLTGGANMESWLIDFGPHQWVLRRLPQGMEEPSAQDDANAGIDIDTEAQIIDIAIKSGVTAPGIIGCLQVEDELGTGFVMQRIAGEALPQKILKDPKLDGARDALTQQCAAELSKIHAMPLQELPPQVPEYFASDIIETLASRYKLYDTQIPVFDLALHWLSENKPAQRQSTFVHGDFRLGNLMVDENGIAAVLDWEQGHIGDPARDLAYMCTPSWRFGNYDKPVGGVGQINDLLSHYEKSSGQKILMSDIHFWMILSSLTWGLGTLKMINFWRTGQDRSLERAVIGRRTSETEIDLLLMLEDALEIETEKLHWALPQLDEPAGKTHASELLQALIEWDETSILSKAEGRELFQARVARNALGILTREANFGPTFSQSKTERLALLEVTESELSERLSNGALTEETLKHLRIDLLERLHIDQPKYAGLRAAKTKWIVN